MNSKWYRGRTLREVRDAEEEFNADKMGAYYEGEYQDFLVKIDLSKVIEYAETVITCNSPYSGANAVWVYGEHNHTLILTSFEAFEKRMNEYEESLLETKEKAQ